MSKSIRSNEASVFSLMILGAMQRQQHAAMRGRTARPKHMYAGTVPEAVVGERRAANKRARAARRLNRSR